MGKKKIGRPRNAAVESAASTERVRVELRLEPQMFERLQAVSGHLGVSINRLVEGIVSPCLRRLKYGKAVVVQPGGFVMKSDRPGYAFVGRSGREADEDGPCDNGYAWFGLNFSGESEMEFPQG